MHNIFSVIFSLTLHSQPAMTNYRIDSEEEALFRSYNYSIYYVQSPSTISHANSAEIIRNFETEPTIINHSSSHGSTTTNPLFLHDKKLLGSYYDEHVGNNGSSSPPLQGREMMKLSMISNGRMKGGDRYNEDEDDRWWTMLAFGKSSSLGWKCLQVTWRFLVSMAVALIVFYIATRPPPPKVSLKVCVNCLLLFASYVLPLQFVSIISL